MSEGESKLVKFKPCDHIVACKGCAIDCINNDGKLLCMRCTNNVTQCQPI